jgi:hypothetical protein
MRNVFDQYKHPENRLTHGLAVCLSEDRKLLRDFLKWLGVRPPTRATALGITEQSRPGDPPTSEDEADRKGLPDIVIYHDDDWCVVIESKVEAPLTGDQMRRHRNTMIDRGFRRVSCVALTKAGVHVPRAVIGRTWCALYEWLARKGHGREWPTRMREYLRVAEIRMTREESYMKEGTLTRFDGFPFTADDPYTYGEAKRLLKLAMGELRKDKRLISLGMDPTSDGRGAITGRAGDAIWDFLQLRDRPKGASHTRYPHLTLGVHRTHLEIAVTIPHNVAPVIRHRLAALGATGLSGLNARILNRGRSLVRAGGVVEAVVMQRHYPTQSSTPVTDARLALRLETSISRRIGPVKLQPEWLDLFALLLQRKHSNIQFGYWWKLPWPTRRLETRKSLEVIADGWCALAPLLDVVRGAGDVKDAKRSRQRARR